ncbi:MAG TPA: methionyl-tRNA formyltransferase [Gemmatimonadales bacterium]|nr:methionyl-tRNA formyltransferase [Gemmatimonadales bacterium]
MRIAFFGTPDFAVPSLRALLGEGFDVAVVVTQPDRAQGRSRSTLVPPPVKEVALAERIPCLQPEKPNTTEFLDELRAFEPTIGVVAAYGHILKPQLLEIPPLGMVNVHASLLPALRGAAPIQHAIIQGLDETGISIMQMDRGMDTGPILLRVPTDILPDETGGELATRLAEVGAMALIEALALYTANAVYPEEQDESRASHAPKITTEMARIRWEEPATRIARLVRALDPKPGAWSELDGTRIKLFGPRLGDPVPNGAAPGEITEVAPAFTVATGEGCIEFVDVQPAGKARLAASDWVHGRGARAGASLS